MKGKKHHSAGQIIRRIAAGLVKARVPKKMTVKRAQLLMTLDWGFALEHFFTNN